jgi:hypothetical protein
VSECGRSGDRVVAVEDSFGDSGGGFWRIVDGEEVLEECWSAGGVPE